MFLNNDEQVSHNGGELVNTHFRTKEWPRKPLQDIVKKYHFIKPFKILQAYHVSSLSYIFYSG